MILKVKYAEKVELITNTKPKSINKYTYCP